MFVWALELWVRAELHTDDDRNAAISALQNTIQQLRGNPEGFAQFVCAIVRDYRYLLPFVLSAGR